MKQIYKSFRSVKLALVLIAYIGLTSALATLVPQGREAVFYKQTYSPFLYRLFMTIGFNTYFRSALFLIPVSLFFINLSTCTVHRITSRFKGKAKPRFGPDIIHIGLLLLIIGALVTVTGRKSNLVYLEKGGSAILPGGYQITLNSFEFLKYKDNRPKDWLSHVSVKKGDKFEKNFTIEVNKPLKVGSLKVYQYTYADKSKVLLKDSTGNTGDLYPGYYFKDGDATISFKSVTTKTDDNSGSKSLAIFEKWIGHKWVKEYQVPVGGSIAGYQIVNMQYIMSTGLKVVKDPGVLPVIIAFILITFGLGLTFVQKLGDNAL